MQNHREQAMRERGQRRAELSTRKAIERGEAGDTAAGVRLAKQAVQPLADAIAAFMAPKKGAGRRHTAAVLLKGVDPHLAAYITVRMVISGAAIARTLRSTALAVTEALETELIAEAFEKANEPLYRAVVRNAEARGLSTARTGKAVGLANRSFSVVEKPWTPKQRLHLGVKLIELMRDSVGLFRVNHVRRRKNLSVHRLELLPEIAEWLAKYNGAAALTRPLWLPMAVPPKPWAGVYGGGYHSHMIPGRNTCLLTRHFPGQLEALKEAAEAGKLEPVFAGLNALQETPWRINKRVLAVMQEAWDRNLPGFPLPAREPAPKPEKPQAVIDDVKGGEHRKAWRRLMADWHIAETKAKGARFEFQRALDIAAESADGPMYFVHRLDFRGRAYANGTSLQPQGPDECRALLEFAEGKPLGERGVWWLGVHGANLFGNDKVSLEDRFQWALGRLYDARDVAKDPIAFRHVWVNADKPWSFLAWRFEWALYGQYGVDHVSHMPVALDGTCNGLQHYSAMLRDEVGGKAVNPVPGDKPSDVYATVAGVVMDKLAVAASGIDDPAAVWKAGTFLSIGIDRKVTKRPVMVLPYGGTYKSCHEYASAAR
jgi:DNA-directed RNA polymerase